MGEVETEVQEGNNLNIYIYILYDSLFLLLTHINIYRFDQGPPETVTPLGHFTWTAQDDLVAKVDIEQVPFFNAPIYTENKQQIGKIDEIFGNIRDYYVSIRLSENIKASSFVKDTPVSPF